jgi:hypothetical protein
LTEIRAFTADWSSHVIRLLKDSEVIESEWLAGPIPIKYVNDYHKHLYQLIIIVICLIISSDGIGKELVSRFTTNIANGDAYYTDSNGKLTEPRRRDYRPTFTLLPDSEPVTRNYYPIITRAFIRDEAGDDPSTRRQLTVLTDRAQGGGSIHDGELELMVRWALTQLALIHSVFLRG